MTPETFAKKYLTPPVAKRYIRNLVGTHAREYSGSLGWCKIGKDRPEELPYSFLGNSFPWEETPEGGEYWRGIFYDLLRR